jgi:hypothetical protein
MSEKALPLMLAIAAAGLADGSGHPVETIGDEKNYWHGNHRDALKRRRNKTRNKMAKQSRKANRRKT